MFDCDTTVVSWLQRNLSLTVWWAGITMENRVKMNFHFRMTLSVYFFIFSFCWRCIRCWISFSISKPFGVLLVKCCAVQCYVICRFKHFNTGWTTLPYKADFITPIGHLLCFVRKYPDSKLSCCKEMLVLKLQQLQNFSQFQLLRRYCTSAGQHSRGKSVMSHTGFFYTLTEFASSRQSWRGLRIHQCMHFHVFTFVSLYCFFFFFRLFQAQWSKRIHFPHLSLIWPSPLLPSPQSLKESRRKWAQTCLRSHPRGCQSSKLHGCSRSDGTTLQELMVPFLMSFCMIVTLWARLLLYAAVLPGLLLVLLYYAVFLEPVQSVSTECALRAMHLLNIHFFCLTSIMDVGGVALVWAVFATLLWHFLTAAGPHSTLFKVRFAFALCSTRKPKWSTWT